MATLVKNTGSLSRTSFKIAASSALSEAVDTKRTMPCGLQIPASWTTTSGGITFQASADGITYADVYDLEDAELNRAAAAGRYILLDDLLFSKMPFLKVRSGTSGSPVNQVAERTLWLVSLEIDEDADE